MTTTKRTDKDEDALTIGESEIMSDKELIDKLEVSYQQYLDGKCSPVEEAFDRIKMEIERKLNIKL